MNSVLLSKLLGVLNFNLLSVNLNELGSVSLLRIVFLESIVDLLLFALSV
jgi:hypothetical protein